MIALLDRVKRLRPWGRKLRPPSDFGERGTPSHRAASPNPSTPLRVGPGGKVGSSEDRPIGLSFGPLSMDQRGATLVTYVLVLPLLILLIFGSFAVWRIMIIRQTLFLGTYNAARELSWRGRELGLDDPEEWWRIADSIVRTEVEGNHLIESGFALNVDVSLPNALACPSGDTRLIDDILFTIEATLTLPTPIRIPFLDPINLLTLTEQHTSYVECPRGWDPPKEDHIY
jgi:hypothetical protein